MFKQYPSPIEEQLDELRDQMWKEAHGDEQRYIEMIKQIAAEAMQRYGLSQTNEHAQASN